MLHSTRGPYLTTSTLQAYVVVPAWGPSDIYKKGGPQEIGDTFQSPPLFSIAWLLIVCLQSTGEHTGVVTSQVPNQWEAREGVDGEEREEKGFMQVSLGPIHSGITT